MEKRSAIMGVLVVTGCFMFMMITGCAGKPVVKAEQPVVSEKQVGPEVTAEDEMQNNGEQAALDEGAIVEQGLKEQAAEEQELKERAPKEQALKEKAAKDQESLKDQEQKLEKALKELAIPAVSNVEFADIHFDFDSYNLSSESRAILEKHANWLLQHKDHYVLIEGHCDERGTNEYNLALGERRAAEAMQYLMDLGIDEARIKTISYGEELPLDSGHNEEAWAKNRRDHFVLNIIKK
jgi:peptidoglycan-associated lipoprotein